MGYRLKRMCSQKFTRLWNGDCGRITSCSKANKYTSMVKVRFKLERRLPMGFSFRLSVVHGVTRFSLVLILLNLASHSVVCTLVVELRVCGKGIQATNNST